MKFLLALCAVVSTAVPAATIVQTTATFGVPTVSLTGNAAMIASLTGGNFSSSMNFLPLSMNGGVVGFKVFGNGSGTALTSSSTTVVLTLIVSGAGSGTFPTGSVPFDYNFTATDSLGRDITWSAVMAVNGVSSLTLLNQLATSGIAVIGSGSIATPLGDAFNNYSLALMLSLPSFSAGETLSVVIPPNSLDVNLIPEPGTGLLALSGMGILLLARRRV